MGGRGRLKLSEPTCLRSVFSGNPSKLSLHKNTQQAGRACADLPSWDVPPSVQLSDLLKAPPPNWGNLWARGQSETPPPLGVQERGPTSPERPTSPRTFHQLSGPASPPVLSPTRSHGGPRGTPSLLFQVARKRGLWQETLGLLSQGIPQTGRATRAQRGGKGLPKRASFQRHIEVHGPSTGLPSSSWVAGRPPTHHTNNTQQELSNQALGRRRPRAGAPLVPTGSPAPLSSLDRPGPSPHHRESQGAWGLPGLPTGPAPRKSRAWPP